jgi:hypothetical protein
MGGGLRLMCGDGVGYSSGQNCPAGFESPPKKSYHLLIWPAQFWMMDGCFWMAWVKKRGDGGKRGVNGVRTLRRRRCHWNGCDGNDGCGVVDVRARAIVDCCGGGGGRRWWWFSTVDRSCGGEMGREKARA